MSNILVRHHIKIHAIELLPTQFDFYTTQSVFDIPIHRVLIYVCLTIWAVRAFMVCTVADVRQLAAHRSSHQFSESFHSQTDRDFRPSDFQQINFD